MKHTPGPWFTVGDHSILIGADDGKQMLGKVLHGHRIQKWTRSLKEAQANARFIVTACNCHDELLDSLCAAVARIELANQEGESILSAWLPDAKAAIAKAKGR